MAPKKGKKVSLNTFLGDSTLGSWADEMDALPTAPAPRTDDDVARDRFGRRDDTLSSRLDRGYTPRDDIPIPTHPPYTAFVGNLSFGVQKSDLEGLFPGCKTVKIISDRDGNPKGFGYVEFDSVQSLTDALSKNGTMLAGRTVRVSVAEPPKERASYWDTTEQDAKFDGSWRRDGPPPDSRSTRDASRRRFEGPGAGDGVLPSAAETQSNWRSSSGQPRFSEPDLPRRKVSGFGMETGAADREDVWTIGSKFKASGPAQFEEGRPGTWRAKEMAPPKDGDWRGRSNDSSNCSMPPTPQMGRRKLELLPKSAAASAAPSPLPSPKMGQPQRSNPFGGAKPVDVSAREEEVANRLAMSRTSSQGATDRWRHPRTPPAPKSASLAKPESPSSTITATAIGSSVRPALSFAGAAKNETPVSESEPEKVTLAA